MLKKGTKVGITACSNGLDLSKKDTMERLKEVLGSIGLIPVFSPYLYADSWGVSGGGEERAKVFMDFYHDDTIKAIFDVSGGDLANEVLEYLDYDIIRNNNKMFWGYSDLTTIINAIYTKTGNASVLYQIRNLVGTDSIEQQQNFIETVVNGKDNLFQLDTSFVRGTKMKGVVTGGNIRCLLKLAGTRYWPDVSGKLLLLEARGGLVPQMITYFNQLKQMGVFEKVSGILLGTFTKMEEENCKPSIIELAMKYVPENIPIACTKQIGHGEDSKGIIIGKEYNLNNNNKWSG